MKYPSFDDFLWQIAERQGALEGLPKDRAIEAFEGWVTDLDAAHVTEWAEKYGQICFLEGEKSGLTRGQEIANEAFNAIKVAIKAV